jgi:hypothetical protein
MNREMDRRLAKLEGIAPPTSNRLPFREWVAMVEQKGWGDIISIRFSNGAYVHHVRRDDIYERLAKLKQAGSIDDGTPVEFAVFHTIVRPPNWQAN